MSEAEATTVEAPRDNSGQFGIEGVEADQGYSHVKAPAAPPADDSPEAVYEDYKRKRGNSDNGQPVVRELIHLDTGEKVEPNLAITAEQAHAALTQSYSSEQAARELLGIEELRQKVDADRAERIQGNKILADHYGVEVEGAPDNQAHDATAEGDAEYVAPSDGELHPEVQKALKHPQVRQAIEQEFSKAETVKGEFTRALQTASDFARASFLEVAPELAGLQPEQFEQGLQTLAQVAPDRFNAAMNTLGRFHQIQTAQQQIAQQKAYAEQQSIETWAKGENARLEQMGVKFTAENVNDVVAYAADFGISRQQLGEAMLAHPILRSAPIQKMMADAAKMHAMQKAPAKAIPKTVPSVMKPGVAASKAEVERGKFQELRSKLKNSGSVDDAYALYKARKRGA